MGFATNHLQTNGPAFIHSQQQQKMHIVMCKPVLVKHGFCIVVISYTEGQDMNYK